MILMIDNYDSFTYTIVSYLESLGAQVKVVKNDEYSIEALAAMSPEKVVISPGPCTPNEAGVSLDAIRYFAGKVPLLGICLGHQAIGQVFGAKVCNATTIMHGKTSQIHHKGAGVFSQLPSPYTATRYHSLVLDQKTLPECLAITAWVENTQGEQEEIMGVRHTSLDVEGVQFHPESVLTEHGLNLFQNFLNRR
ncbi:aminodeoxychorismate/anthranilate synthase component II [Reinekea marina]|uniref:Anthranilate synthase component II n=1 Tax=Reinekea marina TaxID=1310421 RepID=A0ABV7WMG7_9GAMM|nr:aminodeoxychorismate/anthranilate synthase component II [Reinekea marina]MBU2863357.1 aminodeoxychorismate/anthranilate synthase component II [Reinekea forsetii]MDN3650785.1 aminodeoxychorismate/anthranilate synthase component II [Reinekea marina]